MAEIISLGAGDTLGNSGVASKVGIGTTQPGRVLTVYATSGSQLRVQGSTKVLDIEQYSAGNARINAVSGDLEIRRNDSNSIIFQNTSATTHVVIDSAGNVGIGSASPAKKLDVVGNAQIDGTTFIVDSTNHRVGIGIASPSEKLDISGGNILVRGSDGFDAAGETAILNLGDSNHSVRAIYGYGSGGGVRIKVPDRSGVNDLFTILEGSNAMADAYVGIGATSPTARLNVQFDLNWNSSTIRGALVDVNESGTNSGTVYGLDVDVSGVASGTRYSAIFQGGNVGIATTAPSQKLDVNGNIRTSGYLDVNGPKIMSGTGNPSGSATKGSLYIKTDATTATTRLWINTDGGSTWAYLTASA